MTTTSTTRIEIVPFADEHREAAAALLAERHRRDRAREAALPERYGEAAEARAVLDALLRQAGTAGVAARRGGRLAGFLLGGAMLPAPTSFMSLFVRPRSASVRLAGHAAEAGEEWALYRAMYAALAERWVEAGLFDHYVQVAAADEAALDAWFSLGFGEDITLALRETGPVERRPEEDGGLAIHQADLEDKAVVHGLVEGLLRYHAGPPIFYPYLPEAMADERAHQEELLADPANAHWIAYREGRPAGLQSFNAPSFLSPLVTPAGTIYLNQGFTEPGERGGGVGSALLDRSMAWAREAGYGYCALHFMSANVPGARFWLGSGFRPVEHRLHRRVDERVAWGR